MFYHSSKLQYEVRVDTPDPVFAKYFQQAIGGVEGALDHGLIDSIGEPVTL